MNRNYFQFVKHNHKPLMNFINNNFLQFIVFQKCNSSISFYLDFTLFCYFISFLLFQYYILNFNHFYLNIILNFEFHNPYYFYVIFLIKNFFNLYLKNFKIIKCCCNYGLI
jgi:hypothetical protein